MEAIGLSLALLAAFENTIQCFDAVAIARKFDRDLHTATLKLDVARLRLSRWGHSVGLDEVDGSTPHPLPIAGSASDQNKAKEILDQIVELFNDAETKSSKLKPTDNSRSDDHPDCLDPQTRRLHSRLRKLSLASFKPRNVLPRAKWGFYQEKHLRRLIEDITEHVKNLIDLFPAAGPSINERCIEEGEVLAEEQEDLAILEPIVAEQDPELGRALRESQSQRNQTFHFSFAGTTNYGLQQGYVAGTQTNNFGFIGGPKGAGARVVE